MANIAELAVQLTAKTGRFNTGMKGATKELNVFAKASSMVGGRLVSIATGAAAAAAAFLSVRSVVHMIRAEMEIIDTTAKVSDKLGLATEKLAGLHYAAERAGIATTTLDMGLQRMVRRIAEASKNTGEAQGALKELGLNARQLVKLTPDEQFRRIADAMQSVEGQSNKVRLAFKLFDSEGVALVNMLNDGASGLEAMQRRAERLGIAFTRMDASHVEQANDILADTSLILRGIVQRFTIQLAPVIAATADKFVELAISGNAAGSTIDTSFTRVIGAIDKIASALDFVNAMMNRAKKTVLSLGLTFVKIYQRMVDATVKLARVFTFDELADTRLSKASEMMSGVVSQLEDDIKNADAAWRNFWSGSKQRNGISSALIDIKTNAQQIRNTIKEAQSEVIDIDTTIIEAANSMAANEFERKVLDRWEEGQRIIEETLSPINKMRKRITELDSLLKDGAIDLATYWKAAYIAYNDYRKARIENEGGSFFNSDKIKESARDIQAITDAFRQTFGTGKRGSFAINTPIQNAISASIMRGEQAKKQQVYSPQFDTTNRLLSSIDNKLDRPVAVAG